MKHTPIQCLKKMEVLNEWFGHSDRRFRLSEMSTVLVAAASSITSVTSTTGKPHDTSLTRPSSLLFSCIVFIWFICFDCFHPVALIFSSISEAWQKYHHRCHILPSRDLTAKGATNLYCWAFHRLQRGTVGKIRDGGWSISRYVLVTFHEWTWQGEHVIFCLLNTFWIQKNTCCICILDV